MYDTHKFYQSFRFRCHKLLVPNCVRNCLTVHIWITCIPYMVSGVTITHTSVINDLCIQLTTQIKYWYSRGLGMYITTEVQVTKYLINWLLLQLYAPTFTRAFQLYIKFCPGLASNHSKILGCKLQW